jgi:CRP-like cAMP-binding protein
MILRDDSRLPISDSDIGRVMERFDVTLTEWVRILSCYTTEARLRLALRFLLVDRHEVSVTATHEDLAELVCTSREKVTRSITSLRRKGVLKARRDVSGRSVVALGEVMP